MQPHRKRFSSPYEARHVNFSCFHHLPLLQDPWARDLVVDHLALCHDRLGYQLYAWAVMPDHVHLLLLPDDSVADMARILSALKTRTATKILGRLRLDQQGCKRLWQAGGGHDRNVTTGREFQAAVDYIEQNPVAEALVERAEDYAWSSAGSSVIGRDRWW
ncbi:MAG: transposase [Armatimonadetes bacterium]|nr:transposase [Armatimonadota bacterium]